VVGEFVGDFEVIYFGKTQVTEEGSKGNCVGC
jgi:hypothetical protein